VFFKSQAAAAMAASTQIYGEDAAKFQVRLTQGGDERRARATTARGGLGLGGTPRALQSARAGGARGVGLFKPPRVCPSNEPLRSTPRRGPRR
jgi:hypothetical protein